MPEAPPETSGLQREFDDEVREGWAVREGDLLAPLPGARGVGALSATLEGAHLRWPRGVIPYEIDPTLPNPRRVLDAVAHWNQNTSLRVIPRTDEQDYVVFRPLAEPGLCYSHLGRIGGPQEILLASTCSVSSTAHEIGHAVGLYHEQSRQDRDEHIQILWENIDSRRWGAFASYLSGQDVGPYDIQSLMHYGSFTFSINGLPTLLQRDGSLVPSNRTQLSARDIWAVEALYDTLPPKLGVSGPVQGALVRSVVRVQVSASDAHQLRPVEVWEDGAPGFPFLLPEGVSTYDWHTERLPDGEHTLELLARDVGGNTASHTLRVMTDNTPPGVRLDAPGAGAVLQGRVTLAASVVDARPAFVDFHLVPEGAPSPLWSATRVVAPFTLDLEGLDVPSGGYALVAVAEDAAGNTSRTSVPVTVQKARVSLTASVGLKVWGTVPLSADVDSTEPIAAVAFWVEDRRLGVDTRAPYTFAWDTGGVREGTRLVPRRVTAVALDAAGAELGRSAPREVRVLCPEQGTCG